MEIDDSKAYATEGVNLRKVEQVMKRLYLETSFKPGEMRDMAQLLWLFLNTNLVDATEEMGL